MTQITKVPGAEGGLACLSEPRLQRAARISQEQTLFGAGRRLGTGSIRNPVLRLMPQGAKSYVKK